MADIDGILKAEIVRKAGEFMSALVLYRHHKRENVMGDNFDSNIRKIERIGNLILKITKAVSDMTGNFVMPDEKKIIGELYHKFVE